MLYIIMPDFPTTYQKSKFHRPMTTKYEYTVSRIITKPYLWAGVAYIEFRNDNAITKIFFTRPRFFSSLKMVRIMTLMGQKWPKMGKKAKLNYLSTLLLIKKSIKSTLLKKATCHPCKVGWLYVKGLTNRKLENDGRNWSKTVTQKWRI